MIPLDLICAKVLKANQENPTELQALWPARVHGRVPLAQLAMAQLVPHWMRPRRAHALARLRLARLKMMHRSACSWEKKAKVIIVGKLGGLKEQNI
jgi:hypothetical protein